MNVFTKIRHLCQSLVHTIRILPGILQRLDEHIERQAAISEQTLAVQQSNEKLLAELVKKVEEQSERLNKTSSPNTDESPLLRAPKTYNTFHPDYDATVVRNYPGLILNSDRTTSNSAFERIRKFAQGETVPDEVWDEILVETLEEAKTVSGAEELLERRDFVQRYVEELQSKYNARYEPGWVNLNDALFLYWLVRHQNPRVIVQTGVCNGLSSAFMVLALAKNQAQGKIYAVDLAQVFDSTDPYWTTRDRCYGVVIPTGKSSGWLVPDCHQSHFSVSQGDAKRLLPELVDKLDSIDLFYHDSDHTYDHMMFEFREVKRRLKPGGLVVADDISWNSSLWDFADEHAVPAYNFRGSVGVAFF